MKALKIVMVAAMLLLVGNLSAREPKKDPGSTKPLSKQIAYILRGSAIPVKDRDLKAKIVFTLNQDHEIVVLAVHSEHPELASLVKRKLTDKRMAVSNWVAGKKYMVPLRVVA